MGFPTPFPEPDSQELQRFAVRSLWEVVSRLRALQEDAVPLNAFVDAGAPFGVVTLLRVDEVAQELVFTGPINDRVCGQLLKSPLATFVGYDDAGKVQFDAAPKAGGTGEGNEFTASIPAQLLRLQRRSAARVRLDSAKAAVCRIPLPSGTGEREALRVLDIGTGGIALLTHPERFELVVGTEISNCRLDLPGIGGTVVSLRVRHVGSQLGDNKARFCGCEFVHSPAAMASMLARFLDGFSGGARKTVHLGR